MYIYFIYKILAHGLILRGLIIGRIFPFKIRGKGGAYRNFTVFRFI